MGRAYEKTEGPRALQCRHLMSAGRDGKIRLWEAQHSRSGGLGGQSNQASAGGANSDQIFSGTTGSTSFGQSNPLGHSNPRMGTTQAASIGGGQTFLKPLMQMDEHTDWVNQLIYLPQTEALLSCSNDTTIKLWMLPNTSGSILPNLAVDREMSESSATGSLQGAAQSTLRLNSFYTIDSHDDYVRAMAYSKEPGRLFSISDDGQLMIHDLSE